MLVYQRVPLQADGFFPTSMRSFQHGTFERNMILTSRGQTPIKVAGVWARKGKIAIGQNWIA